MSVRRVPRQSVGCVVQETDDSDIALCEQCGARNRISQHPPGAHPVCGKCGSRLTEAIVEAKFSIEDTPGKTTKKRMWIPQLIAVVMLLIALNPSNPYGYYTFLRFVCCAVFAYLAFLAFEQKIHLFAWLLVVTAVVYNPIVRINLTRDIWTAINMVTIIIAIASAIFLKREISS